MTVDELLARLHRVRRNGKGWSAQCPNHDDRQNSLSVAIGGGGSILVHCFALCRVEAVVTALGLTMRELFPPRPSSTSRRPAPRLASLLDEARSEVLRGAQRQLVKLEPYRPLNQMADFIRRALHIIDASRRDATVLGPSERVWDPMASAAHLEANVLAVEAQLDDILARGRLS